MARTSLRPLLGAHMPTAGGLQNAISSGKAIGCEVVQVFTASPRQWRSAPLKADVIELYRRACEEHGIGTTIAHDSYLINLAAPDGAVREKSHAAFREEMERAEALGIDYLVTHMGAHLGAGVDAGLARLVESLDLLHGELPGYKVRVALETTAGQGTCLGADLAEFPMIFNGVHAPERLVICMDTCHMFAAGYDLRTPEAYAETMGQFERHIGFDKLKVIHCNDSQKGLGSRVDRHAHIGQGELGDAAFCNILSDPRLVGKPLIIETPDADEMHAVNLAHLRVLANDAAGG
ncbi:MAG: deoxyribonuclease IV [Capsulimonadaceae bacterium]|nr:deoxyribonuclease IV [Capsulimonadaceae bacterium]